MSRLPKVSEEHVARRKAQILQAAKTVFCRKGFEPTTMQDVVEESGMSRGGVYQYFPSTEAMMQALLDQNSVEFKEYIDSLIRRHEKMWDILQIYFKNLEEENTQPFSIVIYEYFVTGWRNRQRKEYLRRRYLTGKKIFRRIFEEGVKRGEFKPVQPIDAINRFVMNVNDGIVLEATLLNKHTVGVSEQIRSLKMYLEKALGLD